MTIVRTGYEQDTLGSWIRKDPEANLIYTMDWSDWLNVSEVVTAVTYSLQVRANDPAPLVIEDEGIANAGLYTYVQLSGGQVGKTYTVTADIQTDNGNIDRRAFRVKIENRQC